MATSISADRALPRFQLYRKATTWPPQRLGHLLVALVAASCGFPRPADVGPDDARGGDDTPANVDCQLTSIEPSIANTDDVITLEGTFAEPVTVNFPGDTAATATLLGPNRAKARVPALAAEGDLTVTTCGSILGPVPFRRASFATGLGMFDIRLDQAGGAQQNVRLVAGRDSHSTAKLGHFLYVLGGTNGSGSLNSVEQARLNADGSLGPFTTISGLSLVTARQAHTTTAIGKYLYVVGGLGTNNPLSSIERATIAPDGSLGQFEIITEVPLTTARYGHASVVIGNHLYVFGGRNAGFLNGVERAVINRDGSLGPFATVPQVSLATARYGHIAVVAGNYLYIIGGARSNGVLQDVERATISGDGSLSTFASISGASLIIARSRHTAQVIGSYLYVFGGLGGASSLNSVERASLADDGSLGSFASVSGITLKVARHSHTTAVIGNYLYALGGVGSGPLNSIERATFNASGSVATFEDLPDVTLAAGRYRHTQAVVRGYVYVLGGVGRNGILNSIERASVAADGSLGSFVIVPDVVLKNGRYFHTQAVLGDYLYVLGGSAGNTVERATISGDGSLATFALVPGVTLVTARHGHVSTVVENHLYVLGGQDATNFDYKNDVEQAAINPDGSLGTFATVAGVTLVAPRTGHTSVIVGNYLYVLGGANGVGTQTPIPLSTVERAAINADGSLGPFATVSGVALVTARYYHTSAVIGNYVYVLGGVGENFGGVLSAERAIINADGSLGPFTSVSGVNWTKVRDSATSLVVGNSLYVLGGYNGNFPNSIEHATLNVDGSGTP